MHQARNFSLGEVVLAVSPEARTRFHTAAAEEKSAVSIPVATADFLIKSRRVKPSAFGPGLSSPS